MITATAIDGAGCEVRLRCGQPLAGLRLRSIVVTIESAHDFNVQDLTWINTLRCRRIYPKEPITVYVP